MKISKIHIKDFLRFKDFTLDLTYPKGHKKEGQPLDKICFIGQSGTGKTSLLELIPMFLYGFDESNLFDWSHLGEIAKNVEFFVKLGYQNEYHATINFYKRDDFDPFYYHGWVEDKKSKYGVTDFKDNEWIEKISSKPIYFPSNLNYDIFIKSKSIIKFDEKKIIDFSQDKSSIVWELVFKELQMLDEQSAFNLIKDIADNCLDPLLKKINVKIKTELDFKTKDDISFIKIEDFEGNEIPHGLWSTGTKQVILSALPLYLLKPKHTVILFDEPERSLYPDLQRTVVDYYSSLAENCQFFYSTHSPIISSSFDPWEIVELKFNKEGKVYRETYFEGENHVDNYKWNPRYMRWDDILQRVFDLEDDGSPDRRTKLDELATLNVKFKKLKTKGQEHSPEALDMIKSIEKLSKELSKWD
jgi:predicted ATP-dependent endonuclease of OLD family